MRAGTLNRRIVIESKATSRGSSGSQEETWSTFATVWADVKQKSGKEFFAAGGEQAEVDTMFTIRNLTSLDTNMRIIYNSKTYDIYSINEVGRSVGHEIMAKASLS